jgi:co-chaperonin GroES (HSP10)
MKVKGKLKPLRDKVLVRDMQFGMEKTAGGIFLPSDDGKSSGIHPRWGRVFAVGPEQTDVKINDWILVEHGRWSRGTVYETPEGEDIEIRLVDNNSILLVSNDPPNDAMRINFGTFNLNTAPEAT